MTVGMLPVLRCARCGLRGVMFGLACCPRCGARHGWALVDGRLLAGLLAWVRADRVLTVQRHARRVAEQAGQAAAVQRGVLGGLTVPVSPTLGPSPFWVGVAAQEAAERALGPSPMAEAWRAARLGRAQIYGP